MFGLQEHSEESLVLEVVLVDGIFVVSDPVLSVYSILPIKKETEGYVQYFHGFLNKREIPGGGAT